MNTWRKVDHHEINLRLRLGLSVMLAGVAVLAVPLGWYVHRRSQLRSYFHALDVVTEMGGTFHPDKRPLLTHVHVDLSNSSVDDRDLARLHGLQHALSIDLDLSNTSITKDGLKLIVDWKVNKLIHDRE